MKLREKTESLNDQLNPMKDEYYSEVDSIKALIQYSHIAEFTQEIAKRIASVALLVSHSRKFVAIAAPKMIEAVTNKRFKVNKNPKST
ncbi:MAG: hypothetical protein PHR92_08850 [Lachnospiraceae bacterium]|nr:hypothetical protein [Lachnospiraceae bacterium]